VFVHLSTADWTTAKFLPELHSNLLLHCSLCCIVQHGLCSDFHQHPVSLRPCAIVFTTVFSQSYRTFELDVLTYKCLHHKAPAYISQLCPEVAVPDRAGLQSAAAGHLVVPDTLTSTVGRRCFYYAASSTWNSLPSNLTDLSILLYMLHGLLKSLFSLPLVILFLNL